jgi:hypothetical protein
MSSRLDRYRRNKARSELRGDLAYPVLVCAGSAAGCAVYGVANATTPLGWASLAAAPVLGAIGLGMVRGRSWIRWPAAALFALGAAAGLALVVRDGATPFRVLHTLLYAAFAGYLAMPATGELFRAARGPRERDDAG